MESAPNSIILFWPIPLYMHMINFPLVFTDFYQIMLLHANRMLDYNK